MKPDDFEDISISRILHALCSKCGVAECLHRRTAQKIENRRNERGTTVSARMFAVVVWNRLLELAVIIWTAKYNHI
jgi:hypothetical protein